MEVKATDMGIEKVYLLALDVNDQIKTYMSYLRHQHLILMVATVVSSVFMSCEDTKAKRNQEQEEEKVELARIRAEIIANNELMDKILKVKVLSIDGDKQRNRWEVTMEFTNYGDVPILAVRGQLSFSTILDGQVCMWSVDYDDEIRVMASKQTGWALSSEPNDSRSFRLNRNCPSPASIEPSKLTAKFRSCTIVLQNNDRLTRTDPDSFTRTSQSLLCQ